LNQSNGRTYLPDTQIEIISPHRPCAPPRYVLFDFDGTISLIREGWQGIMAGLMLEYLLATPQADDEVVLRQLISDLILHSTGRPTIDQMIWLAEEVARRGGQPKTPDQYKNIYLDQLRRCVNERIAALKRGQVAPADLTIPGALDLLAQLDEQGITCYLASGTERADVINEVAILGLTSYFAERIYGPHHSEPAFSKEMVIQQIIREHDLHGCELLSFGDGRVEIAHTAEVDGIAIGVASNEIERQGVDEVKRAQLIQAGAVIIVPDFRESEPLLEYLFKSDETGRR
jgi:beta-phosphoglucomutase-like phosphatase (HAD superfamily)